MTLHTEFFQILTEDLPVPVFVLDRPTPNIVWINQAGQAWLGYSLHGAQKRSMQAMFTQADLLENAYHRSHSENTSVCLRDIQLRIESDLHYDITFFPFESYIGVCLQTVAPILHNESEASAAMGLLLAHEIKNPLSGIDGAAQLLRHEVISEDGQSLINLIRTEINRVRRLTERMEQLGDHDPQNYKQINIHEILRRARLIEQSAYTEQIRFIEHYDPSLPDIYADADTLMQAVLNLIKNAAQAITHSGQNGVITLESAYRPDNPLFPINIQIIDDGPGISPMIQSHIGKPFVTDKPNGQGLGLSLVRKVVAAHGGHLQNHTKAGKTVFSISLPLTHRTAYES